MSDTNCHCAECPTPELVELPGTEGDAGADGAAGTNAYTTIASTGAAIAKGASGTIIVSDATIFPTPSAAPYQRIFIQNRGYYSITGKSGTTLTVTYLNIAYNLATETPTVNDQVVPAGTEYDTTTPIPIASGGTASATATLARAALGVGGASLTVYAAGTAYQLTATSAKVDFGTTDPTLTITSAGTWLIMARARIDYTAATFAAVRTGALKLRRTNNTAADLASGTAGFLTDIITTLTYTLGTFGLQPIIYTTTNVNDLIELWGSISVVPTAGSIDVSEASIVAIKLFDGTV